MTLSYQLLYLLVEHIRLACTTNAYQHIVGILFQIDVSSLQSYLSYKFLLSKYDLLDNILSYLVNFAANLNKKLLFLAIL